ncbi:hypothetical protein GCM10022243_49310 [Saccharothrix violaceirubra]|uniref:Transcriptional regulator with XRE-family HTH domain n=1 Tax=Saccharothrix violaceirubra TaxID=413306 RepID=A0A7W7WTZ7_9PSEU|nr:helix-turn-helix transcriptional regulator [Saccharothrix violaceirubra]MBB4963725.1 transcriptional regulator with XRE-family HTH domain [Saccharothrix violaceirubra]
MTVGDGEPRTQWAFGERLTASLRQRGWSQNRFAKRSGLSPQTVSNLVRGYMTHLPGEPWKPSEDVVRRVASGLEERPSVWLRLAGYKVEASEEEEPPEARHLAGKLVKLAPADFSAIEAIVDSLLRARGYDVGPGPVVHSGSEVAAAGDRAGDEIAAAGEGATLADTISTRVD